MSYAEDALSGPTTVRHCEMGAQARALNRHDRVGIAMNHQRRYGQSLQVFTKVGGAERIMLANAACCTGIQ